MAKYNPKSVFQSAVLTKAMPCLGALSFFMVVCLSLSNTVRTMALLCVGLALVGGVVGFSRLRDRITLPMVLLALYVVAGGVSTFYAVSGKFALEEFLKVLISFSLLIFMLAVVRGTDAAPGRRIAAVLEFFAAISGLVSIDLLSTRVLSTIVLGVLGLFNPSYSPDISGLEVGTRMVSFFENPNVFAGCMGIGILLSLSLVLSSEKTRERCFHTVCLSVSALAFLLAFSMGATVFIAVAFLVYLVLELKERRGRLLLLMIETLAVTVVGLIVLSKVALNAWTGVQPLPMLCIVVCAAVLCLLDHFVGRTLGEKIANHSKVISGVVCALLTAAAIFAVVAYNMTGSITLDAKERLNRSIYPKPGEYTVEVQSSAPLSVTVTTQNRQETMMHKETQLYRGSLSECSFTVPEDSVVVHFLISGKESAQVDSIVCKGPETVSIPLEYKLLPDFISNRLQGLFANQNAIQRTVFFEDGMKLFARSPVIGLGMGSFENGIKSVQGFYYETKYAHNHYIQTLAETGVIGLLLLLGVLASNVVAIYRNRYKAEHTHVLTPALGAALVFIAGHSAMEVNLSFYAYIPMAFAVLGLTALCCGDAVPMPKFLHDSKQWIILGCAALMVVFSYFLVQNVRAANLVEKYASMDSLVKAEKMDQFENADYMLSYVMNASNFADNEGVKAQADLYAARLAKLDSNTIPYHLAIYYFENSDTVQGIAMVEKYLDYVTSDSNAWNQSFRLLEICEEDTDVYRDGLSRIVQMMNEWTENNPGTIKLNEESQAFLAKYGY